MEEILYRYNPWWEERRLFEGAIERPAPMETIKEYLRSRQPEGEDICLVFKQFHTQKQETVSDGQERRN